MLRLRRREPVALARPVDMNGVQLFTSAFQAVQNRWPGSSTPSTPLCVTARPCTSIVGAELAGPVTWLGARWSGMDIRETQPISPETSEQHEHVRNWTVPSSE